MRRLSRRCRRRHFNPRAPRGARHAAFRQKSRRVTFQSTCPARGTTAGNCATTSCASNFNPRAPRGARQSYATVWEGAGAFQSTCPARGTTQAHQARGCLRRFQSTCPARGTTVRDKAKIKRRNYFNPRAPRGARPHQRSPAVRAAAISIHVPREGHDMLSFVMTGSVINFNPRAPRGARRQDKICRSRPRQFQSTCPARGTTKCRGCRLDYARISIHVPREGHDNKGWLVDYNIGISIHVPREGHDLNAEERRTKRGGFQSTCPARGTTRIADTAEEIQIISIHVPREGHDVCTSSGAVSKRPFQSTCPARGTTPFCSTVLPAVA